MASFRRFINCSAIDSAAALLNDPNVVVNKTVLQNTGVNTDIWSRFLFQYGGEDHPELKSVPRALDLLANDADKTLLAIAAAPLALGRPFDPTDCEPGADLVIIISDPLWRTAFGSDPRIIGRTDVNYLACARKPA